MGAFIIEGGRKLEGRVTLSGSKNAVLPILASSILLDSCNLSNVPYLSDVVSSFSILKELNCDFNFKDDKAFISSSNLKNKVLLPEFTNKMRASVLFLGSLLGRFHEAKVSFPGGCDLGKRPLDIHLDSLRKLGIEVKEEDNMLNCRVIGKDIKGAEIFLPFPSVGATENIILASCLCKGTTYIYNYAAEPEIEDLALFLNKAGAKITFEKNYLKIKGVKKLNYCQHEIIPDRIEAVTFMSFAASAGGNILIENPVREHIKSAVSLFEDMGCKVAFEKEKLYISSPQVLKPLKFIRTMPYPGFPTDGQALIMASLLRAEGVSKIEENIFSSRFKHVPELRKLGADIEIRGKTAVIKGGKKLTAEDTLCTDLRGGASLVCALLNSEGTARLSKTEYIQRGYCNLENKLRNLGASIQRERESGE